MSSAAEQFLSDLAASRLLAEEEVQSLRAESSTADGRELAKQLVSQKRLTRWQAERLLNRQSVRFGKYLLLQQLGQGGMGAVFQARQEGLGRMVALKLMSRELAKDAQALARFNREIEAAAALNHPNIVHAFDADVEHGVPFLVMEYVAGEDLGAVSKRLGMLPWHVACEYCRQAAAALDHAHRCGMVHRDIKPANLLLTKDDQGQPLVKVLDFGLARFQSETREGGDITHTGQIIGTPDFISPEQATSTKSADIRSDIYSLGCTLYRLLCGNVPYPGTSIMERLMARATRDPEPMSKFRSDLPPGLAAIVQKMMARNVAQRYQSPAEVVQALLPYCDEMGVIEEGATTLVSDVTQPIRTDRSRSESPAQPEGLAALGTLDVTTEAETLRAGHTLSTPVRRSRTGTAASRKNIARRNTALAVGSIVLVLSAIVGINLVQWWNRATLIIEWPLTEREGAEWVVDGKSLRLPADAQLVVAGPAGRHTVRLLRHGFEPLTLQHDLARGESKSIRPEWVPTPETQRKLTGMALLEQIRTTAAQRGGEAAQRGLRRDLTAFTIAEAGTEEARQARTAARQLIWPADEPLRSQIDLQELKLALLGNDFGKLPELAAIYGTGRLAHWGYGGTVDRWIDDEHVVSIGADGLIRVWNLSTFEETRQFRHDSREWGLDVGTWVVVSPNKKFLAAGANGHGIGVRVWDIDTGKLVFHFEAPAYTGSWSADSSRLLVACGPVTADPASGILIDAANWEFRYLGERTYWRLCFAADDQRILGIPVDRTGQVDVLSPDGEKVERTVETGDLPIHSLMSHRDLHPHAVLLAFQSGPPRMIDLNTGEGVPEWNPEPFETRAAALAGLDFEPTRREIAVGGAYGSVRILNATTGATLKEFKAHFGTAEGVRFLSDGRLATIGREGAVRLWNASSGEEAGPSRAHVGPVLTVDVSADGTQWLTGGHDGFVNLWAFHENQPQATHDPYPPGARPNECYVTQVRFHPSGEFLALRSEHIQLELVRRADLGPYGFPQLPVTAACAFSPDGGQLVLTQQHQFTGHVFDVASRSERCELRNIGGRGHVDRITAVAYSADARTIATASSQNDRQLILWNAADGSVQTALSEYSETRCLSFSPDGKWLALNPFQQMTVINLATRRAVPNYWSQAVWTAFSPDGRFVAAATPSGHLLLYETKEWQEVRKIDLLVPNAIVDACWLPDSRHILTANRNGSVYLLRLEGPPGANAQIQKN